MVYYSRHGVLLGSLSGSHLPPLFSNIVLLTSFRPSNWILSFWWDKQTGLSWLGKVGIGTLDLSSALQKWKAVGEWGGGVAKKELAPCPTAEKCHLGRAINHTGLWCVYLLRCVASLSSTLLFTPLPLSTHSYFTLSLSFNSPFLFLVTDFAAIAYALFQLC